jgi:hypothetical protein
MSKNLIGTLLRIVMIFVALFSFWSILLGGLYFIVSYLFDLPFNLKGFILFFIGFIIFRVFFKR